MIGIIGFNDLHLMQYLYKYTNVYDEKGIEYEVIYWNRSNITEMPTFKGTAIPYNVKMNTYQPFWKKIGGFLKYTAFVRKIIKTKNYDKLIILTTQTAMPLYDLLTGQYAGRYIYDYRDLTKERIVPLYEKMVRNLFRKSYCTMISSKGFLPEIGLSPAENILVAHNTQIACSKTSYHVRKNDSLPIRIVYWGMVRQAEFNQMLCDCFGNDARFDVTYHGDGYYKELQAYCENKKYENIHFTGRYSQADIPTFIDQTDILHCLYANDGIQGCAMPVKAYDAVHYRLPTLIAKGSYLEEFMNGMKGIFAVDVRDRSSIADSVCAWYNNCSEEEIEQTYAEKEAEVFTDDAVFRRKIEEFSGVYS